MTIANIHRRTAFKEMVHNYYKTQHVSIPNKEPD